MKQLLENLNFEFLHALNFDKHLLTARKKQET